MVQLQVSVAKNVEECVEFAPEGGKVVVNAGPRGSSSGVELRVALQALEVRFTEESHWGVRSKNFDPKPYFGRYKYGQETRQNLVIDRV